jgi:hypothetical protein
MELDLMNEKFVNLEQELSKMIEKDQAASGKSTTSKSNA